MDEGAPDLSNFSGSGGAIGFVAQRCSDRGDALDKFLVARGQYLRKKKKEKTNVWNDKRSSINLSTRDNLPVLCLYSMYNKI